MLAVQPQSDSAVVSRPIAAEGTILIVEDEQDLVESIRFHLQRRRYRVLEAGDGETAVEMARREAPDLILLDLLLPRRGGREVAVLLRSDPATRGIPIIMLTALSSESDVVLGLQLGADDYVTKPFSVDVLMARVEAVMRRRAPSENAAAVFRAGPIVVDRLRHVVEVDGEAAPVTLTEFRLMEALVRAKGRVLTRDQLMSKLMGPDIAVTDRTIDVHVMALRRKLGRYRDLVETVRGVGYRLADLRQSGVKGE